MHVIENALSKIEKASQANSACLVVNAFDWAFCQKRDKRSGDRMVPPWNANAIYVVDDRGRNAGTGEVVCVYVPVTSGNNQPHTPVLLFSYIYY